MQLTVPRILKRPAGIGLVLILALLALLGSLRWPLSQQVISEHLKQALERNTGYTVERHGDVHFTALPWPSLQVADLSLVKPASPQERVSAPLVKARINLGSWLFGSPKVVGLSVFDPTIHLVSAENFNEFEALSGAVSNFLAREGRPELKSLRIARGTIMLDGVPWMQDVLLNISNTARSDLRLRADGRFSGHPVALKADIGQGASPSQRPIQWAVAAPSAHARFNGILFSPRSLDAEGDLTLTIVDGPELARTLRVDTRHAARFSNARLAGQARVVWPVIQIRQAMITKDREEIEGSVEMTMDGRNPSLSATLDTKRLDLTSLMTDLMSPPGRTADGWPKERLDLGVNTGAKVDVRLSAQQLQIGTLTMEGAALSGHLRDGRIEGLLNEGSLLSGTVKGRISLSTNPGGKLDVRAQSSFDRVDFGDGLAALGLPRLRGIGTGQFSVTATGSSVNELVGALEGRSQVTFRNGEVPGIDIDRLPGRIERTLAGAMVMDGRTRFQSLVLQFRIAAGVASIVEGVMTTSVLRAPLEGTINLLTQRFDLGARLQQGTDGLKAGDLRLKLEGPWSAPVLTPDLIGRGNRS